MVDDLQSRLTPENSLLVFAHKNVEPHLAGYDYGAGKAATAHWGAIDGKNDWDQFDTAVIFGLPYRDRVWATNTFIAVQGIQDDSWLSDGGNREWATYKDIRRELIDRQLAVSVIQAINRIRCRRVIDANGNCKKANIYLLLPRDATGDSLLRSILDEMPGIVVSDWDFELDAPAARQRKPRRSNHLDAVLTYMANAKPGVYTASFIQKNLGIARDTWRDVKERLKEPGSAAHQRLLDVGARLCIEQTEGRYESVSLIKA